MWALEQRGGPSPTSVGLLMDLFRPNWSKLWSHDRSGPASTPTRSSLVKSCWGCFKCRIYHRIIKTKFHPIQLKGTLYSHKMIKSAAAENIFRKKPTRQHILSCVHSWRSDKGQPTGPSPWCHWSQTFSAGWLNRKETKLCPWLAYLPLASSTCTVKRTLEGTRLWNVSRDESHRPQAAQTTRTKYSTSWGGTPPRNAAG